MRDPASGAGLAIAAVWILTGVNVLGVRQAGQVQIVTTALKILPLALLGVAGLVVFDRTHFAVTQSNAAAIGRDVLATVTLTMWAFTGLDAATIPAGHIRDPERTISRATLTGTLLTAAIYIISSVAVMGIVPPAALAKTTAPFAEAAGIVFGGAAALVIAGGAAISAFGALNGWTLVVGQVPQAAARDGLFPAAFGNNSRSGTPATAIIVSAALATVLIAANYTRGLVGLFTFTILLATLGALIPYAFAALAGVLIEVKKAGSSDRPPTTSKRQAFMGGVAFLYVHLRHCRCRIRDGLLGIPPASGRPAAVCLCRAHATEDAYAMMPIAVCGGESPERRTRPEVIRVLHPKSFTLGCTNYRRLLPRSRIQSTSAPSEKSRWREPRSLRRPRHRWLQTRSRLFQERDHGQEADPLAIAVWVIRDQAKGVRPRQRLRDQSAQRGATSAGGGPGQIQERSHRGSLAGRHARAVGPCGWHQRRVD